MKEENLDIRWKQRFAHYKMAFALLEQTMTIEAPSDAERLIRDRHIWMEALKDRNQTVHTYEEKIAIAVEKKIRESYFPALAELHRDFSKKVGQ